MLRVEISIIRMHILRLTWKKKVSLRIACSVSVLCNSNVALHIRRKSDFCFSVYCDSLVKVTLKLMWMNEMCGSWWMKSSAVRLRLKCFFLRRGLNKMLGWIPHNLCFLLLFCVFSSIDFLKVCPPYRRTHIISEITTHRRSWWVHQ